MTDELKFRDGGQGHISSWYMGQNGNERTIDISKTVVEHPTEGLRYVVRYVNTCKHNSSGEKVVETVRPEYFLQQLWAITSEDQSVPAQSEWRDVSIEWENNNDE